MSIRILASSTAQTRVAAKLGAVVPVHVGRPEAAFVQAAQRDSDCASRCPCARGWAAVQTRWAARAHPHRHLTRGYHVMELFKRAGCAALRLAATLLIVDDCCHLKMGMTYMLLRVRILYTLSIDALATLNKLKGHRRSHHCTLIC